MPVSDLPLLIDAAKAAAEVANRFWRQDPKCWDKGGGAGPVTEADLEVDALLRARLTDARPDYGWLSEETEDGPARLEDERLFIVDPIDGTRAFAAGERTWAHSLSVVERGRVTAGVVLLPRRDKLYAAALGQGATLNGAPVSASTRSELAGATVLAARPNFDAQHWKGGTPPVERQFRSSLAYRLSLIGEGRFDAMLTLRDSWEWDIAAGTLIAAEAGATVTDRAGADLRFNSSGARTPGVLAAAPAIHMALSERLL